MRVWWVIRATSSISLTPYKTRQLSTIVTPTVPLLRGNRHTRGNVWKVSVERSCNPAVVPLS